MVTALSKVQGINLSCLGDVYRPRSLGKAEKSGVFFIRSVYTHFLQFLLTTAFRPQPLRKLNTSDQSHFYSTS